MAQQYTRKMIRDVLVQMLNDRPLNKITVKDIVTTCEINRNTFYYYYRDIYAILRELFQMELQKAIDEFNDTLSWEDGFIAAAKFALENKKAIYHIYHSLEREELERYIYDMAGNVMSRYVDAIGTGIKASESDKKLITDFYQSALTEMLLHWISSGMEDKPERVIRRIGRLFDGNILSSLKRSAELNDTW